MERGIEHASVSSASSNVATCVRSAGEAAPRGARHARRTFAMSYGGDGTLLETRERFCEKPGSNGFESRLDAAVLSAVLLFSMTLRKSITHAAWAARPCLLKRCDRPRLRVWRPLLAGACEGRKRARVYIATCV